MKTKSYIFSILGATLVTLLTGCTASHFEKDKNIQTVYVGYDKQAVIPPGVVRYCWEEPVVEYQDNGPGLNGDRTYYQPSYVAIRMSKQGKWRPCRSVPSEVRGETKNER